MKSQTQIDRKNSTAADVRQRHRRRNAAGMWGGSREIHISLSCRDNLDRLAIGLGVDALVIAAAAIRNYLDFMEKYPAIAKGQPIFTDCKALLGFFDPKQPLLVRLDHICEDFALSPTQLITNAINTYVIFARRQSGELRAQLIKRNPGEIDPEQIAHLLSQPNQPESTFYNETVSGFVNLPFQTAIQKARGLLGLIAPHPGFAKERVALEMITEGADRLRRTLQIR